MFVVKPPLTGKANAVDEIAKARYNKLQPRKAGPFRIINMQPQTVVIDEDEVLNMVLVLGAAPAALGLRKQRPEKGQTSGLSKTKSTRRNRNK